MIYYIDQRVTEKCSSVVTKVPGQNNAKTNIWMTNENNKITMPHFNPPTSLLVTSPNTGVCCCRII